MRREAQHLLEKAIDSLVVSVELFNRPHDRGRVTSTLILLDHAFEMLLKAAIVQRGGRIRGAREGQTIGFDTCVRKGLSEGRIRFLTEEQALVLQAINGHRDAAQHDLLEISEGQLYLHAQSGVTLFRDLLKTVFGKDLANALPERILPLSTSPPTDLTTLFETELAHIKKLLGPKRRRRVEVEARLRPLAILDTAMLGGKDQPSAASLRRIADDLASGKSWQDIFKGVAAIQISPESSGPGIALRLTKKEGVPIQLVKEGTPGASVVAVRRVDELSFYSLGAKDLASKLGINLPKLVAVVEFLKLRDDDEYYKEFVIGRSLFKRYSPKAIEAIKTCLTKKSLDDIWAQTHPKAASKSP